MDNNKYSVKTFSCEVTRAMLCNDRRSQGGGVFLRSNLEIDDAKLTRMLSQ